MERRTDETMSVTQKERLVQTECINVSIKVEQQLQLQLQLQLEVSTVYTDRRS